MDTQLRGISNAYAFISADHCPWCGAPCEVDDYDDVLECTNEDCTYLQPTGELL